MTRRSRRRRLTTKEECLQKLRESMATHHVIARMVKSGSPRLKPRELYDALDGLIGIYAEVQMTLQIRSRIRPHSKRKRGEKDLRPDLWWPRYWKMVRELEAKGVDPKSAEAAIHLENLADDIFN